MFFENLLNPTLPLRCLCAVRRSVSCYFTAIVHAFCCCHIDYFNSLPASFPMVQLSSFSRPCLQQLGPLPTFLASLTLMWWWTVMVSHESSRAVLSNPWPAFPPLHALRIWQESPQVPAVWRFFHSLEVVMPRALLNRLFCKGCFTNFQIQYESWHFKERIF